MTGKPNAVVEWMRGTSSLLWHSPGRAWAGMMAAGELSLWLTAGAAMAWTIMSAALVWLFKDRLTSDDAVKLILTADALVGVAILAITGREISLSVTKGGLQADIGKDDGVPAARVTTTTTTTTAAAAAPATDGELAPTDRVER